MVPARTRDSGPSLVPRLRVTPPRFGRTDPLMIVRGGEPPAGILRPGNMTAFRRRMLVTCSLVLVGACSTQPAGLDASEAGGDCLTPLEFSSRTYTLVKGTEVGTVAPGRRLGTGQFAPCDDGGGSAGGSRQVYSLPSVPPEQAVVLPGDRDRGAVYLSVEPPATAWDADLLLLMDAWSVQPRGPDANVHSCRHPCWGVPPTAASRPD